MPDVARPNLTTDEARSLTARIVAGVAGLLLMAETTRPTPTRPADNRPPARPAGTPPPSGPATPTVPRPGRRTAYVLYLAAASLAAGVLGFAMAWLAGGGWTA